ncbi:MBL fold metallo-hydrolase [candidate division KSB1 bacterium]
MIQPVLSNESFLANVASAPADTDVFHLWWLGQSGYLIKWGIHHLLIDPYLSDSLTHKYDGTEKPHVRMTEKVIPPEKLDFIDLVTSSHNHTDHLDHGTLKPLMEVNPGLTLVVPEANRNFAAERLGIDPESFVGLDHNLSVELSGIHLTGIASAHNDLDRDDSGHHPYLGYVIRIGPWSVYHPGDTLLYDGLAERLKEYSVHLALLPINGNDPARGIPGNMDSLEAAGLAKTIGARLVIPNHYEMFEFNSVSTQQFQAESERLDQPYRILKAGERWSSSELT